MTDPTTHSFTVPGISCDHCERAIEEQVAPVDGVEAVVVDIEAKTVSVTGGDRMTVIAAIDAAGYDIA